MLAKTQLKTSNNIYKIERAREFFNQRCLIVGLFSMKEKNVETHLTNVKSLIEANEGIVVGNLVQRRGVSRAKKVGGSKKLNVPMSASTFIGKGKAEELVKLVSESKVEKIVFLNLLSDTQKQRLSEMTDCQIIECEIITNNE